MTPQKRSKRPWSRGDKLLVIVPTALAVLALAGFFWNRAINTLPNPLPPPHPMPAVNARDYYIAASDALADNNKIAWAIDNWTPGTQTTDPDQHFYSLAAKEKLVAENAHAVHILHQGFPYPYAEPLVWPVSTTFPHLWSFSTTFTHYLKIRQLGRYLALDRQVKAAQGNWAGAVSANLDAVQMGETALHSGLRMGILVSLAWETIGPRHIWEAVPHLSAPEARAAARRLEAIRAAQVPFADMMQQDKWGTQTSLRDAMAKPDWANRFIMDENAEWNLTFAQNPQAWAGNAASVAGIRIAGNGKILANNARWMDKAIAQVRQPYAAHPAMPPLPNDLVNQILLPPYGKLRFRQVAADTQNALLLTAFALHAYQLDHGTYPAKLTALVPGYLKAVPTDPFALSGPLRYKLAGAKYVLYSVGPDGKDDNGKAIFDATKPAPGPNNSRDERRSVDDNSKGDVLAGVNTL